LEGPSEARGVDEPNGAVRPGHERVDGVPGRARLLEHDRALLPHQPVEQARLADVRPADDREPRLLRLHSLFRLLVGQDGNELVEQVARTPPVQRGDREPDPRARA
jgi:hypothetical protein